MSHIRGFALPPRSGANTTYDVPPAQRLHLYMQLGRYMYATYKKTKDNILFTRASDRYVFYSTQPSATMT